MTLNWKAQVVVVVIAVAAIVGWVLLNNAHQREIGALELQLAAKQAASDSAKQAFAAATDSLTSKVADFQVKAARIDAIRRSTDVAAGQLRSARDSLAQAVTDSLATIQQLRDRAARLIQASDSAEAAHRAERSADSTALVAAKRTFAFVVDSVQQSAQKAIEAALARAETAERLAHVEKGWRARLLSRCGPMLGYGGMIQRGGGAVGPAVIVGCRLTP